MIKKKKKKKKLNIFAVPGTAVRTESTPNTKILADCMLNIH